MKKKVAEDFASILTIAYLQKQTKLRKAEVRLAYPNGSDDYHVYLQAESIIYENDFMIMFGLASAQHHCCRYNVYDKEFEIW